MNQTKEKMKSDGGKRRVFELFLTFFKIGLFTFGGGYAMIPLIRAEVIEKKKWISDDEFTNIIAIAESTPGPIAINSATYIGTKTAGFFGALMATLGVVLPSFTIIYVISLFFDQFLGLEVVANAFKGIQVAVGFLILSAGVKMLKKMKKNAYTYTAFAIVLLCAACIKLFAISFSSIYFIIAGALCGIFITLISGRRAEK